MRTRWLLVGFSLIFVVTLALVVGWRLSSEAMAVLVGVAAGVFASIPTSLLVVWVTMRQMRGEREAQTAAAPAMPQSPPVVVVTPGAPQMAPGHAGPAWSSAYGPAYSALPAIPAAPPRRFSVIGGDVAGEPDGGVERAYAGARRVVEDVWQS